MTIPPSEWKWIGYPAHFCDADRCKFRMATIIGDRVVSTVGDYWPPGADGPHPIGWGRNFETMVFAYHGFCDCSQNCGRPNINPRELDAIPANRPGEAAKNHIATCHSVARICCEATGSEVVNSEGGGA